VQLVVMLEKLSPSERKVYINRKTIFIPLV